MFGDNQFFMYITAMFTIIMVSRLLIDSCSFSISIFGICNLIMICFYALLAYICNLSLKETKNTTDKQIKLVRYGLNGMLMFIITLTIILNINELLKNGFKKRKMFF